jgi:hypothetical protein
MAKRYGLGRHNRRSSACGRSDTRSSTDLCSPDLFGDDGHDQLVAERRQQKGQESGRDSGQSIRRDRRSVHVTQQKGLGGEPGHELCRRAVISK